jgi:hypothetical protein
MGWQIGKPLGAGGRLKSQCGCINSDMKDLNRRVFVCAECGHAEGQIATRRATSTDGEERRNRVGNGPTCGEIGEQGRARRDPGAGR